ncbi:hypothetical protein ABN028_30785 [Actinopolymorpha sp. B17G11]|uniref:WD40 repeat domain-containing protein n=1 Tax=Actinopolymorpha sp. B17G11 TaxID=3160861 RepID=UPI0032E4D77E
MTERLHDLLERLADDAPRPRVDHDLFRRARGARRRDRMLVAGGAVALVVLIVAGISVLSADGKWRTDLVTPVTENDVPAMPSRLYRVPEHVNGVEDNLAIGPVAAAYYGDSEAVVLVSAVDGQYRRVRLPGLIEFAYMIEHRMMALSPDGTKLAYAWHAAVPENDNPRVPSGVAVVDLMTGEVRRYARPGGQGVEAGQVSWSPNGRFLTYTLTNHKVWDGSSADGQMRIERLDVHDGSATVIPFPRADGSPAVSDDGRVGVVGFDFAWLWDPKSRPQLTRVELGRPMGTAAWSPTGARIAIGSDDLNEDAPIVVIDPRNDSRLNIDRPGLNQVAAWLDDSRIVVLHVEPQALGAESETDVPDRSLQVLDVDRGTVRTRLPLGQASDEYRFATALLQRPSRDFPEPDWPPNWGAIATTTIKIGLALLLASSVAGSLIQQRRRRRDP